MHATAAARVMFAAWWMLASPLAAQLDGPLPNASVVSGTLSFYGHATVGDFTGITDEVAGEMRGGSGLSEVRGWVEAPVKSLTTGDRRRDRDLNKSMESDKYPTIRFELTGVTADGGRADSMAATLAGRMLIHGVAREVRLPAVLRVTPEGIRVRSHFPLNLKDYEIGGLSRALGMLRMREEIEVHVDVTFGAR